MGILTSTGAIYIGSTLGTATHTLHAYKLYVALHGEFDLLLDNSRVYGSLKGVLIAPDRPHKIVGRDCLIAVSYIVPETPEGIILSRYHSSQDVFALPPQMVTAMTPRLRRLFERGGNREELTEMSASLVRCLLQDKNVAPGHDLRVASALEYIRSAMDHRVTVAELSSKVGLSAGRLEHLFSEQVGIPISRYMTWYRLYNAVEIMPHKVSLTEVAHKAGFADLSHLGRTFRKMLGLSPSAIQQYIDWV
jgi:AraC-like DNA-binding protein